MAPTPPKRRYLPISYDVAGKRVAVVGSGMAALKKLDLLTRTQAITTLYAPAPRLDLSDLAARSGADHVRAYPTADDLKDVALLFVATDDEDVDARMAYLARAAGVAVNAIDRPHLSTFAIPSIVDRGSVTVAIASDGAAPVLAQRVRALIDTLLPPAIANLGDLAQSIRSAVRSRLPENTERRRFWWRAFDGPAGAAALSGDLGLARALALLDLEAVALDRSPGRVHLVRTVAGSEDLLTLRAQRLLLCTDVIVHDKDVSAELLAIGRRDAARILAGTAGPLLARLAREGRHVVRLATGNVQNEIDFLRQARVDHELIPVASASSPLPSSIAA